MIEHQTRERRSSAPRAVSVLASRRGMEERETRGREEDGQTEGGPARRGCSPGHTSCCLLGETKTRCDLLTSSLLPSTRAATELNYHSPPLCPSHPLRQIPTSGDARLPRLHPSSAGECGDPREVSATSCHPATSNDNG